MVRLFLIILTIMKYLKTQRSLAYNCNTYNSILKSCQSCPQGYKNVSVLCQQTCTVSNCETCLNNSTCYACLTGYYLTPNNNCLPCPSPCTQCVLNSNNIVCLKCPGSTRTWDGSLCTTSTDSLCNNLIKPATCPRCGALCQTCFIGLNSQIICSICANLAIFDPTDPSKCTCQAGATLVSGSCVACNNQYGKYCISCNSIRCLSCFSKKNCVILNGICICSNSFKNTISTLMYANPITYSYSGKSTKVFFFSSSCAFIDFNNFNCLAQCNDLYDNCLECSGETGLCYQKENTQIVCPSGTYADQVTKQCVSCKTYFSSCVECTQSECLTCTVNGVIKQCPCSDDTSYYILNSSLPILQNQIANYNFQCMKCPPTNYCKNYVNYGLCGNMFPNCLYCDSESCNTCNQGSLLNSITKTCMKCKYDIACVNCDEISCLKCSNTISCKACDITNCMQCSRKSNNQVSCLQCADGFFYNSQNNSCVSCNIYGSCVKCNSQSCTECDIYHVLVSGNCFKTCNFAYPACTTCSSVSCLSCDNSYYLDFRYTCQKCSDSYAHCLNCDSLKCVECQSNAELDNEGNCSCQSNYVPVAGYCVSAWLAIALPVILLLVIIITIIIICYLRIRNSKRIVQLSIVRSAQINQVQIVKEQNEAQLENSILKLDENVFEKNKEVSEEDLCQICKINQNGRKLQCNHEICSKCLLTLKNNKTNVCPFCRFTIDYQKISKTERSSKK